jgi:hypothetical protein
MTPRTDPIRTRSGLSISRPTQLHKPSPQNKSRATKPHRVKKAKKDKIKTENAIAKLEKPLSELTKDWVHVPVVDIEAYVNRSVEERRKEVEEGKQPGKVKRPMNSFMLYRKAYQNRTKNWCLQNNHQVVSQVCGDSWPLEPDSVREQFNEWARLERLNHQNAHPGYKFSPSKAGASKPAKRKTALEESEESELEDFDWERGQSRKPRKHGKQESRPHTNQNRLSASPYPDSRSVNSEEPSYNSHNRSSYYTNNPGMSPPAPYNQSGLYNGQYYQQTVHPSTSVFGAEDILIRKTVPPGMSYPVHGYFQEVKQEQRIDPTLMGHSNPFNEGYGGHGIVFAGDGFNNEPQWYGSSYGAGQNTQGSSSGVLSTPQGYDNLQIHEQHLQMLKGNHANWKVEALDEGHEFDPWMDTPEPEHL